VARHYFSANALSEMLYLRRSSFMATDTLASVGLIRLYELVQVGNTPRNAAFRGCGNYVTGIVE
jgi:hypothetical protein